MKKRPDFSVLIALGLFGLVGLGCWIAAIWIGLGQYQVITQWPRTEATVLSSRVILVRPEVYGAEIRLGYRVNDKPLAGSYGPSWETSSHALMQKLVEKYPAGSTRQIPYDPQNPAKVALDAGYSAEYFMLPLIFAGIALIMTLVALSPWLIGLLAPLWRLLPWGQRGKAGADHVGQIVGGIFAALGMLFLGIVGWALLAQARTGQWPQIEATIDHSSLLSYTRRSRSTKYYALAVDYRFELGGKTYVTPYSPASGLASEEEAAAFGPSYSPGSKQTIRYNPDYPWQISLGENKGDFTWGWILGGMGVVFTGLGLLIFFLLK